jgi:type VI secretion system protein ImpC
MSESRSSVFIDVNPSASKSATVSPDLPFRILVVGDFSGRAGRNVRGPLSHRKALIIDRDNIDEVVQAMRPSLEIASMKLDFSSMDDFHPDHICERSFAFRKLAEMRNHPPQPAAAAAAPGGPARGNLLDEILAKVPDNTPVKAEDANDLDAFLKKITAPYLEARPDPREEQWSQKIDSARADLLRGVLHHESFQNLEASWRAVAMLVDRLDTDGPLKIHLFDATLDELLDDPEGLQALFVRKENPWAVIVGAFVFAQTPADTARLRRLAQAARAAGAPFLAEAAPPSGENDGDWQAFRGSAEAHWLGLAVPRFLLRLPYGARTSPIEAFKFEEMPRHEHASYLWGNPAFCCAYLLGLAFLSEGWSMRPGMYSEVESLPLHIYPEDGESVAKPCAEVLLSDDSAEFLLDNGIMPLMSRKGGDSALLLRFQSVAQPLAALAGRWKTGT